MKWKVDVDETIHTVCTYLVEAKTADKARAVIQNGEWNKVELYDQFNYDGEVHGIQSVEPFKEEANRGRT